ncbi:hypothetical protein GPZ77_17080 [Streptomyces sp. QHH-9511]|uniref:hypothetical protein n=1 Tax=Streptomyces sp. QHH-9511 TaxID=2684468 RepID=UPI00131703B8|nr:hypothetical protein [Streptomyces sp. QHH-9511]QGZ49854.1 hypothetical protein GPZ77_17080 [Streptomyces sp. QHH-9511]QJD07441.1 hypothetical protein [Streptomyces sp.]
MNTTRSAQWAVAHSTVGWDAEAAARARSAQRATGFVAAAASRKMPPSTNQPGHAPGHQERGDEQRAEGPRDRDARAVEALVLPDPVGQARANPICQDPAECRVPAATWRAAPGVSTATVAHGPSPAAVTATTAHEASTTPPDRPTSRVAVARLVTDLAVRA